MAAYHDFIADPGKYPSLQGCNTGNIHLLTLYEHFRSLGITGTDLFAGTGLSVESVVSGKHDRITAVQLVKITKQAQDAVPGFTLYDWMTPAAGIGKGKPGWRLFPRAPFLSRRQLLIRIPNHFRRMDWFGDLRLLQLSGRCCLYELNVQADFNACSIGQYSHFVCGLLENIRRIRRFRSCSFRMLCHQTALETVLDVLYEAWNFEWVLDEDGLSVEGEQVGRRIRSKSDIPWPDDPFHPIEAVLGGLLIVRDLERGGKVLIRQGEIFNASSTRIMISWTDAGFANGLKSLLRLPRCSNERRNIQELARQRDDLERQLREKNAEIARIQAEQCRIIENRSRFFINLIHELRTPLSLIAGPLEAIVNEQFEAGFCPEVLKTMFRQTQKISQLLDSLKVFSRLDNGKKEIHREILDVTEMLNAVLDNPSVTSLAESVDFRCVVPESTTFRLYADREMLVLALVIVLQNAFRFTPAAGTVTLGVEGASELLRILVSVSGTGLASDLQEHLSDHPFATEQNDPMAEEGGVLGFSLVRGILHLHAGQLYIGREKERGTQIRLELPLYRGSDGDLYWFSAAESCSADGEPDSTEEKPAILVVEDNRELQKFLFELLDEEFEPVCAYNGAQAVELLEAGRRPALIISDIMMPVMDGHELLACIMENDEWRRIPFLFLTAKSDEEERLNAFDEGIIDYIAKPFSALFLLKKVRNIIRWQERYNGEGAQEKTGVILDPDTDAWNLSRRERQVGELLLQGKSKKEIADHLNIAVHTVKRHVENIYAKLNVHDRFAFFEKVRREY